MSNGKIDAVDTYMHSIARKMIEERIAALRAHASKRLETESDPRLIPVYQGHVAAYDAVLEIPGQLRDSLRGRAEEDDA